MTLAFPRWLLGLAVLAAGLSAAHADQLDDVKSRGKLVCGVLNAFEPYGYQDAKTREQVGYEVDFCRELARHLGVQPELKVVTTQGRIPELTQGRVDVLAALISYTKERAQQVDYSGIYLRSMNRFMVMKASGLTTADQVKDRKIGVSKGSVLEKVVRERYPQATVLSFDDKPSSYLALRSGKVDALLTQEDTLRALKNLDPKGDDALILPESIYPTEVSFIVRKNEEAFKARINDFLAQAEKSGTAQRVFDKWLGAGSAYKMTRDFAVGVGPAN